MKSRCACWTWTRRPRDLSRWSEMVRRLKHPAREVSIGLVGKYVEYEDSYKSLKEALLHGGLAHDAKVNITWIESERLKWPDAIAELERFDGILVPGGFGRRGVEGMLSAIRYAREFKVPYFGICLGMQTMVIEFARNVCGLRRGEFDRVRSRHAGSRHLQIARIEGRRRAGRHHAAGRVSLPAGRKQLRARGVRQARNQRAPSPSLRIQSRIRRRADSARLAADGRDAGRSVRRNLRAAEDHPWYLGCQFHPEFKSKPLEPHPLFRAFIGAAVAEAPATRRQA